MAPGGAPTHDPEAAHRARARRSDLRRTSVPAYPRSPAAPCARSLTVSRRAARLRPGKGCQNGPYLDPVSGQLVGQLGAERSVDMRPQAPGQEVRAVVGDQGRDSLELAVEPLGLGPGPVHCHDQGPPRRCWATGPTPVRWTVNGFRRPVGGQHQPGGRPGAGDRQPRISRRLAQSSRSLADLDQW